MLEKFCSKWTVNVAIAFLTCLATYAPITRLGIALLLLGYLLFGVSEVLKNFSITQRDLQADGRKVIVWTLSFEFINFVFFFLAVFIGIYLGWR